MTSATDKEYVHDSVFVYVGDTVFVTRWRTAWRDRVVHDTVRERTTDTVIKEVVKDSPPAPSERGNAGWGAALALFALMVVYMLFKSIFKSN